MYGSSVMLMCSQSANFTCILLSFFQDGLKAVDNLKPSIEKLATDLHTVRKTAAVVSSFLHSTLSYASNILIPLCSFFTDLSCMTD